MILTIFLSFILISLILITLGLWKNNTILQFGGWFFIFLMAMPFFAAGNINHSCDYNLINVTTVNATTTVNSYSYVCQTYTNSTLGIWFLMISILGFISTFFYLKNTKWGSD